jgi:hypothetical protein
MEGLWRRSIDANAEHIFFELAQMSGQYGVREAGQPKIGRFHSKVRAAFLPCINNILWNASRKGCPRAPFREQQEKLRVLVTNETFSPPGAFLFK